MTVRKAGKYRLYRDLIVDFDGTGVGTIRKDTILNIAEVDEHNRQIKVDVGVDGHDFWRYWEVPVVPE